MIRHLFSGLEPKTSLLASSENQKKKIKIKLTSWDSMSTVLQISFSCFITKFQNVGY